MRSKIIILFLMTMSVLAQAQEGAAPSPAPAKAKPDTKVKINFEDEMVFGSTENTDLLLLTEKMPVTYKKMIKIRENFLKEMDDGKSDFATGN